MGTDSGLVTVRAFDALAADYDRLAEASLFRLQRQGAHAAMLEWLPRKSRVLDIGCGTGIDAVFLAESGMDVLACDPSPEMQSRTWRRASLAGVAERVRVLDCGLETLPSLLEAIDGPRFDAVVSNFGALNCVPSLDALAVVADRYLRAGGSMLLTLIGRSCAWELAYLALTGRRQQLGRRRTMGTGVPVADIRVPTYYHAADALARTLGPALRHAGTRGLGVLVPPPYLEPRWQQVPGAIRTFTAAADGMVARWPLFRDCGDHVLTRWVKARYAHA